MFRKGLLFILEATLPKSKRISFMIFSVKKYQVLYKDNVKILHYLFIKFKISF